MFQNILYCTFWKNSKILHMQFLVMAIYCQNLKNIYKFSFLLNNLLHFRRKARLIFDTYKWCCFSLKEVLFIYFIYFLIQVSGLMVTYIILNDCRILKAQYDLCPFLFNIIQSYWNTYSKLFKFLMQVSQNFHNFLTSINNLMISFVFYPKRIENLLMYKIKYCNQQEFFPSQ